MLKELFDIDPRDIPAALLYVALLLSRIDARLKTEADPVGFLRIQEDAWERRQADDSMAAAEADRWARARTMVHALPPDINLADDDALVLALLDAGFPAREIAEALDDVIHEAIAKRAADASCVLGP